MMKKYLNYIEKNKLDVLFIILICTIYFILIFFTWEKWGNPVIDCGRDAYVAENLLTGKRLYSEIYYLYPPFAPFFLALMFFIFGVNLNVLYLTGIITAFLILLMLYVIARHLLSPAMTFFYIIVIMLLCCFNPFNPSIFNYIFPYTYSAPSGLLFSCATFLCLISYYKTQRFGILCLAALLTGVSLIIKLEYGVTLTAVLLSFILFTRIFGYKNNLKQSLKLTFLLVLVPFIAATIIITQSGWQEIINYIGYTYSSLASPAVVYFIKNQFNINNLFTGLDKLTGNSLIVLLIYLSGVMISISAIRLKIPDVINKAIFILAILLVLTLLNNIFPLNFAEEIFYIPLKIIEMSPVICLIYIIYSMYQIYNRKKEVLLKDVLLLIICLYTLIISIRFNLVLNVKTYATFYAPFVIIVFFYFIENIIRREYMEKELLRKTVLYLCICLIGIIYYLSYNMFETYSNRNYTISCARGQIQTTNNLGKPISKLIKYVKAITKKNELIVLLPEETLVYFLSDRKSPTKYYDYLPFRLYNPELENALIKELNSKRVYLIAISNKSSPEYNKGYWGKDYNKIVSGWISKKYNYCGSFGDYQTESEFFKDYGIKIYQKSCPLKWNRDN